MSFWSYLWFACLVVTSLKALVCRGPWSKFSQSLAHCNFWIIFRTLALVILRRYYNTFSFFSQEFCIVSCDFFLLNSLYVCFLKFCFFHFFFVFICSLYAFILSDCFCMHSFSYRSATALLCFPTYSSRMTPSRDTPDRDRLPHYGPRFSPR